MVESLFLILIGAFIGWSFPQPEWAKTLQSKFLGLFKK
jgi:hypothetical protein